VTLVFLFFSEVAPAIDPHLLDPLGTASLYAAPAATWISFLAIACYAAVRLPKTLRDRSFPGIPLAIFSAAYIGFFVFWDAAEAFLFTAPALLPLWLIAHRGYLELQHTRAWKATLVIASIIVSVNNWLFIQQLKDDAGLVGCLRPQLTDAPRRVSSLYARGPGCPCLALWVTSHLKSAAPLWMSIETLPFFASRWIGKRDSAVSTRIRFRGASAGGACPDSSSATCVS
jgi:hypothetical protein